MEAVLAHQTQIFLFAAILGLFIGLLYDFFRCIALTLRIGRIGMAVHDLLFCLLCLLSFIIFMLVFSQEQMRWYIPGGMLLGGVLYHTALSGLVRAGLMPVLRGLRRGAGACRRLVLRTFSPPRGN